MRVVAVAIVLAGCGFRPGVPAGPQDAPAIDGVAPDGAHVTGDALPGACAITDPDLRLCLEFDEPNLATASTAVDGSGLHHDATLSNIGVVTRTVPATSQAIVSSTATAIRIAKSSDFDLQTFTLAAWVNRTAQAEYGVFDTNLQYTISINSGNGDVECAVSSAGNPATEIASQTGANEWDLVACTYDGSNLCAVSFRNGNSSSQSACTSVDGPVDTGSPNGSAVAAWAQSSTALQSHLIGAIDQVRVWARALTSKEICVAGGMTGCQ